MRINLKVAAVVSAGVLALAGPAAFADTVYNNLDNVIDTDYEVMNLTYDASIPAGSTGAATLKIQVDGKPDHPGCNIQGGAHYIALNPVLSTPGVATVELSGDGVFDACSDSVTATVHAIGVGSTNVTFVIDSARTSNDPNLTFGLDEARFTVNVTGGTVQPPVGCDKDPAAPAWSAAIMQKSGVKPGSKDWQSVQSSVAKAMGQGATFAGYAKNAHTQYEDAVQAYVAAALPNRTIVSAQAAARPGWSCSTL